MRTELLAIGHMTPGMQAHISALHFGDENLPKVYIQSSLHADEMPGSLAAYHLHKILRDLEQQGRLKAHIVLVPMCNPLGLGQTIDYMHIGRFHLPTAQNFNRLHTIPFAHLVLKELASQPIAFTDDIKTNTRLVREVMGRALDTVVPSTNVQSMHLHLMRLAYDADIVLDLHCDNFSVLHMYTTPLGWEKLEVLARYLGSACQLLAPDSNASSFDEVFSTAWLAVQKQYPDVAIDPHALVSCTVEFRGEYDLSHDLASQDADGIVQFLAHQGYIDLAETKPVPELLNEPHPLFGLYYLPAPVSGIVVYKVRAGDWVSAGQEVAEIVNPITLESTVIKSEYYGFVYALSGARVATGERKLMSISCPFDIGNDGLSP